MKIEEKTKILELPENNCFSFIRLILCLFVVIDHTATLAGINFITGVSGKISVPAFFIISGFWIPKSLLCSKSIKDYAMKRVIKIFPQLFFVLWFCAFTFVIFSNLSPKEYFSSPLFLRYMIKTLIQFTGVELPGVFENTIVPAVNGSCWTIHIEILFYCFLPFLFVVQAKVEKLSVKDEKNIMGGGGGYNIMVLILYFLSFSTIFVSRFIKNVFLFTLISEMKYFVYFCSGMFMFFNFAFFKKYERYFIMPAMIIVVLTFLFFNNYLLLIYPMALCIVLFFIAFNFPKLERFCKLGDLSYGLYIVHFPVIKVLCLTNVFILYPVTGFIFVMVLSLGFAELLDAYIQKPLQNLLNKSRRQ